MQLVVPAGEGDVVGAAELVAEVVAGAALQGLAVLHHRLDGVGGLGAGKLFLVGLAALDHGNGQIVLAETGVAVQLGHGLGLGLLARLMDGVALLPPELPAAQEGAGGLFPPDHAAPLVVLHGQFAVAVQHAGPVVAEHGLAGGPDGQPLFQLIAAAHGHPGHFGGKAVDQVAFLFQQALGDQHRHGHVLVAGGLEAGVQVLLDVLPDGLAVRPQDDEALHAGILHQFGLDADVGVPLGEVFFLAGDGLDQLFRLFCHSISVPLCHGRAPKGIALPPRPEIKSPRSTQTGAAPP